MRFAGFVRCFASRLDWARGILGGRAHRQSAVLTTLHPGHALPTWLSELALVTGPRSLDDGASPPAFPDAGRGRRSPRAAHVPVTGFAPSSRWRSYVHCWASFGIGALPCLICLSIYPGMYLRQHGPAMIWAVPHDDWTYFLARVVSARPLASVSLTRPTFAWVPEHFLTPRHGRMLQAHLVRLLVQREGRGQVETWRGSPGRPVRGAGWARCVGWASGAAAAGRGELRVG